MLFSGLMKPLLLRSLINPLMHKNREALVESIYTQLIDMLINILSAVFMLKLYSFFESIGLLGHPYSNSWTSRIIYIELAMVYFHPEANPCVPFNSTLEQWISHEDHPTVLNGFWLSIIASLDAVVIEHPFTVWVLVGSCYLFAFFYSLPFSLLSGGVWEWFWYLLLHLLLIYSLSKDLNSHLKSSIFAKLL